MTTAIIGLGRMGILHAAISNVVAPGSVSSICDIDSRLIDWGKRILPSIRFYASVEELVEEERPDMVFVTTPSHTHLQVIRKLVGSNVSGIFCEKPLSNSFVDSVKAVEIASGLTTAVGYQKRFSPIFRRGKELLDSKALGKIRFVRGECYVSDVFKHRDGWRYRNGTGGVLLDFAPHLLDILLWYFGCPKVESAITQSFYSEADDLVHCLFRFEDNLMGSLDASWSMRGFRVPETSIEVQGVKGTMKVTDGYIRTDLDEEVKGIAPNGKSTLYLPSFGSSPRFLLGEPEYSLEDQEFTRCSSSHIQFEPNFRTATEVDRLIGEVKQESLMGR